MEEPQNRTESADGSDLIQVSSFRFQVFGDWRVWLLFLALQVPSLRAFAKYVPAGLWPIIPIYLIATWLFYADLLHDGQIARLLKRFSGRAWFLIVLLVGLFVIQGLVYPQADALKYQGRGNPQDDALVAGGDYLVHGLNPYEALTFRREFVSAGPGWIILALPFTQTGTMGFFNPVWLLITAVVLWRVCRNFRTPALFLVILMSSLAFWELTVTGSDMISIGCALLVSAVAVHHAWKDTGLTRLSSFKFQVSSFSARTLGIVLLAFVATSRIVFAYAVPLIGGFLWRRNRKRGLLFVAFAGGLTLALHLVFYLWNPPAYFPLHRFSDTDFLPGIVFPLLAAATAVLMLILSIQTVKDDLASWTFNLWLALTAAMFFSALGDLIGRDFIVSEWEGANYLAVVIPIFVAWIVLSENSKRELSS